MTRHNGRQLLVTHLGGNTGDVNHRAAAATVERKQIGRPTDYTPEIAREIADRMIDGNPLRAICQQKDMPDEGTVYRWIARHPEFRELYAHARELQALRWGEEVLTIADDKTLDPHDRRGYGSTPENGSCRRCCRRSMETSSLSPAIQERRSTM